MISIEKIIEHFRDGREIELSVMGREYFMQPNYDVESDSYIIYDCDRKENVFCGEIEEVLDYKFEGDISLRANLEIFDFKYIL